MQQNEGVKARHIYRTKLRVGHMEGARFSFSAVGLVARRKAYLLILISFFNFKIKLICRRKKSQKGEAGDYKHERSKESEPNFTLQTRRSLFL